MVVCRKLTCYTLILNPTFVSLLKENETLIYTSKVKIFSGYLKGVKSLFFYLSDSFLITERVLRSDVDFDLRFKDYVLDMRRTE